MDPSWYGGHNPYTQTRMRELELEQVPHQAERPPMRAYYTDQGPYGPGKTPIESRDVSRGTSNSTKDQNPTPTAGPSSSSRPALKSFYTDQGAYGPGYGAAFVKRDVLDKPGTGSSKKQLKSVPEEDEGPSSSEDAGVGRSDGGKGKQAVSGFSCKSGDGASSSRPQSSIEGDAPNSSDRPQLQTRRSRGWFF
ncbi:hypothetical protein CBER1_03915 [Cercospora berteroae]|uniref:Uncharacterized protein n=1 Tax=Cercospora berteroae TaxID=357750 RepID=A0A2S6CA02_9PEZI|nr:hypothetical protein CBER1_03915 [Cercospora berteroae]